MDAKDIDFYGRVSTEEQSDNTSIPDQIRNGQNWVFEQYGFSIPESNIFIDDKSGSSLDRPELQQLIKRIEAGHTKLVVMNTQDRISRNTFNVWRLVLLFLDHDIQAYCVREHKWITEETPESALKTTIDGYVAHKEREWIQRRMIDGKRYKLEVLGEAAWGNWAAPYGYKFVKRETEPNKFATYLEIEPDEAETCRLMRDMLLDGMSCQKIADWLNEKGVPTPASTRGRQGRQWWQGTVYRILTKDTIYGTYHWDDIEIPIDPIMNAEDRQLILESLEDGRVAGRYMRKHRYLLAGLLRCTECNYRHSGVSTLSHSKQKRYTYYVCGGRHHPKQLGIDRCPTKFIKTQILDDAVWEYVKGIITTPDILSTILDSAGAERRETIPQEMERLSNEVERIRDKQKAILAQLASNEIKHVDIANELIDEWEGQAKVFGERHAKLVEELKDIEQRQAQANIWKRELTQWQVIVNQPDIPFAHKRSLIKRLIREIETDGQRMKIHIRLATFNGDVFSDNTSVVTDELSLEHFPS